MRNTVRANGAAQMLALRSTLSPPPPIPVQAPVPPPTPPPRALMDVRLAENSSSRCFARLVHVTSRSIACLPHCFSAPSQGATKSGSFGCLDDHTVWAGGGCASIMHCGAIGIRGDSKFWPRTACGSSKYTDSYQVCKCLYNRSSWEAAHAQRGWPARWPFQLDRRPKSGMVYRLLQQKKKPPPFPSIPPLPPLPPLPPMPPLPPLLPLPPLHIAVPVVSAAPDGPR